MRVVDVAAAAAAGVVAAAAVVDNIDEGSERASLVLGRPRCRPRVPPAGDIGSRCRPRGQRRKNPPRARVQAGLFTGQISTPRHVSCRVVSGRVWMTWPDP